MSIVFKFLEVGKGDAILISADGKNILVDGGEKYQFISKHLETLRQSEQKLDLVILTHIDHDHIQGINELLSKPKDRKMVQKIWFNPIEEYRFKSLARTSETSFRQGIKFCELVEGLKTENPAFTYDDQLFTEAKPSKVSLFDHITIHLLSPNKEKLERLYKEYKEYVDKHQRDSTTSRTSRTIKGTIEQLADDPFEGDPSPCNGSSIAFILTYNEIYQFLLLADAHIDVIVDSLRRMGFSADKKLKVNFVKLSHHGSRNNINQDFLDLIESDTFIISTNGSGHDHPDAETICKLIINHPNRDRKKHLKFLFNYEKVCDKFLLEPLFKKENREQYNFSLEHLNQNNGLKFGNDK